MVKRACYLSLDIDGVLHPQAAAPEFEIYPAATPGELRAVGLLLHCDLLAEILEPYPLIQLLVHSSWRHVYSAARFRELLAPLGSRIVAVAPPRIFDREAALLDLMARRQIARAKLIVLDDQPALFTALRDRVVFCSPQMGLAEPTVIGALRSAFEELE